MLPKYQPDGWLNVVGHFWATACDGRGHRDGQREYAVKLMVSDFHGKYYVGGEARFTKWQGGSLNQVFLLPAEAPSSRDYVQFVVPVSVEGATGRLVLVSGLQVRPHARLSIHMPAWRCRLV